MIAGHRAVAVDEYIECPHRLRVAGRGAAPHRFAVVVRAHGRAAAVAQPVVNVDQAGAGHDVFGDHPPGLAVQVSPQFGLFFVGRGETDVTSLAGDDHAARAGGHPDGNPQSGAGTDHQLRRAGPDRAGLQRQQPVAAQFSDAVGAGFEVVEQPHRCTAEHDAQCRLVDRPLEIGHVHAPVDHRSGNAETGCFELDGVAQRLRGRRKEVIKHGRKVGPLGVGVALRAHEAEPRAVNPLDQSDQAFGGADIAAQNHCSLLLSIVGAAGAVPACTRRSFS